MMLKSVSRGGRNNMRIGISAACALLAGTVLAGVVSAASEKSYFIDTRRPVVAFSNSAALSTTPLGMLILVR